MKDRLLVNGIQVMAYCGCQPEEHERRQPFEVDIEMRFDTRKAAASDDLNDTIDYDWVLEEINNYFKDNKIKLIERMAQIIADIILSDERIAKVKVALRKLQPPVSYPLEYSGIIITRTRD